MVEPILNSSIINQEVIPAILDKFSPVVTIFKAVGVIILVYILFLILKTLLSWRASHRIGKIEKNVEEINEKLSVLIAKLEPKTIDKKESTSKNEENKLVKKKK